MKKIWKKINRPYKKISFGSLLDGIQAFSQEYNGQLVTETMLVRGLNTDIANVAEFIKGIKPSAAY